MKVYILIYLIFIIINNIVIADDRDCLGKLLLNLFAVPSTATVLCAEVSGAQYTYKSTCLPGSAQNLTDLVVTSKYQDPLSLSYKLSYSDIGCFTNLTTLTLERLVVTAGFLGASYNKKSAENVYLNYCHFYNGLITANSISQETKSLVVKVDHYSRLVTIDYKHLLYQKNFEVIVSNTSSPSNFPSIVTTLDEGSPNIMSLSTFKADIVGFTLFKYFVCDSVSLNVYGNNYGSTVSNLQNMTYINQLSINYIDDSGGGHDYPNTLTYSSTSNKIKNLTLSGSFKTPSGYIQLPSTLEELYILSESPNFNIDGSFPFWLLSEPLRVISVGSLGLNKFPILPSSIESIKLDNNNFGSIQLPDLSSYSKLRRVSLTNCGFTTDFSNRTDYCYFESLLNNNDLQGYQPQCFICYQNDTANHLTGNSRLSDGICEKGSIVPNLILDSDSDLYLFGSTLGLKPPLIKDDDLKVRVEFQLEKPQELFKFAWPPLNQLPDTISMYLGSELFKVPTRQLSPILNLVKRSGFNIYFDGLNFSYNISNYQIKIYDTRCLLVSADYYGLACSLMEGNILPQLDRLTGNITNRISGEVTQFFINTMQDITITYLCPECKFGSCNNSNGVCSCYKGYGGVNCDHAIPLLCSSDCGESQGHGSCNTSIGECVCNQKWTDDKCSTPNQFLTSASSTLTTGGIVNLYGWLGYPNVDLSIKIGDLACDIKTHSETFANCSIGAGSGTKSITIYQNGKTWIGNYMFHYTELEYKCPKDCSLNGAQNGECIKSTGQCKCYQGWGGYDCNSRSDNPSSSSTTTGGNTGTPEIPKSNTTINGTDGSTIITNQQTSYEISILSLVELDILDNVVLTHNLTNKWINNDTLSSNSNIHTFTQNITESCSIIYKIEEVKEPRDFEFAGLQLRLDSDTIKMTVIINNYPFTSSLNKLQLRIESIVGENSGNSEECNNKDTQVDSTQIDQNQLLNYITISRNEKVLYGRFINRVLSDTRESFITTKLISTTTTSTSSNDNNKSSVIIGLDLPFFSESLVIDPDFSVLVSSSFKKCSSSSRAAWVLPVSIVVPVVGVAAIIIIGSIIIKKNHTSVLIIKDKLKSLQPKKKQNLYMPSTTDTELNKM